jgi:hypothetical protein
MGLHVMQIYAIEITSCCNLQCSYCPQPSMSRIKEHMSINLFEKAIDYSFIMDIVVGHLFGEALLHPELLKITRMCHERGLAFGFSTNTLLLNLTQLEALIDAGLSWIVISFHTPQAKIWVNTIKQAFPNLPVFTSPLETKHDWCGQVGSNKVENFKNFANQGDCIFHTYNLASITAQGYILACWLDASAKSRLGNLLDYSPREFELLNNEKWFELCEYCHLRLTNPTSEYVTLLKLTKQIHQYRQRVLSKN